MPIIEENGMVVLVCGEGDILIGPANLPDGTPVVNFHLSEKGAIDREGAIFDTEKGIFVNNDNIEKERVRIVFGKEESLDVLIERLQVIKNMFKYGVKHSRYLCRFCKNCIEEFCSDVVVVFEDQIDVRTKGTPAGKMVVKCDKFEEKTEAKDFFLAK